MPVITWNDKYSVGIREMDNQHKKLADIINELNDAMSLGKGKDVLGRVLSSLVDYTKTHFSAEERLMKTHGYPEYSQQKSEHDDLTKKVFDIQQKYLDGKTMISLEVMNFLKNWLINHIQGSDMKYASFLNNKGVV